MKGQGLISRVAVALLVLTLVVGISGLGLAAEKKIVILNTSDLHGNLLAGQKDKATNKDYGSASVLAGWVAKFRAEYPSAVLLFDDGDAMQGPAISTVMRGKSVIEVFNAIGYSGSAIGNHEFDWGLVTMAQRISEAKYPYLAANIFVKSSGQRPAWVKPYAIFDVDGVKVAAIGVTTTQTPTVTLPETVKDLEFRDPAAAINALIPEVKAQGAQVVVVVGHIGGEIDKQGKVTDEIAAVAASVQGVDLILGGHSHTQVVGKAGSVPVLIPYYNARAIGASILTFDTDQNKVVQVDQQLLPTFADAVTADAQVQAIVDRYNKDLAPVMAEILAQAPSAIARDYDRESPLGNLVADIMLLAVDAEIAFTNAGGLRADVPAGPITLGRVWEVMPFDNTLVTMNLTGAAIRDILANKTKGMVQLSGLRFTYTTGADSNNRQVLDVLLADGSRLDPNKKYKVVTNNFMATGGDNYASFKSGTEVYDTNILIRDAMINYFKAEAAAGRAIEPTLEGRAVQTAL